MGAVIQHGFLRLGINFLDASLLDKMECGCDGRRACRYETNAGLRFKRAKEMNLPPNIYLKKDPNFKPKTIAACLNQPLTELLDDNPIYVFGSNRIKFGLEAGLIVKKGKKLWFKGFPGGWVIEDPRLPTLNNEAEGKINE